MHRIFLLHAPRVSVGDGACLITTEVHYLGNWVTANVTLSFGVTDKQIKLHCVRGSNEPGDSDSLSTNKSRETVGTSTKTVAKTPEVNETLLVVLGDEITFPALIRKYVKDIRKCQSAVFSRLRLLRSET